MSNAANSDIVIYPGKVQSLKSLALSRFFVPTPLLVVNREGIFYNPIASAFTDMKLSITWPEMKALFLQEVILRASEKEKIYRFLAIEPKDIEDFGHKNHLQKKNRFALWAVMAMTKIPFAIVEETIQPYALDSLLTQIFERYKDEIRANGVEIREMQHLSFG